MAQQGSVTDFISPEGQKQLQEAQSELTGILDTIGKINTAGKGIVIELKGVKDIGKFTELSEKARQHTEDMTVASKKLQDVEEKREAAQKKAFDAQLARDNSERDRANKAIADRYTAEKKAEERRDELRKKRLLAIDKQEARELKAVEAAIKREEQLAAAVKSASAKIENALESQKQKSGQLNNAYDILRLQYSNTAKEAKILGIELGTNDIRFKEAQASAMKMYNQLLKVEEAVGQSQRKVGQYNQAAFALSQVLREGPAFAYSYAQGLLAISNNIPILADNIQMLRIKNEELVASGGKAVPIWKTLSSAIFSWQGALTIAVSAITIIAARFDLFSEKVDEATKHVKEFEEALASVGKQSSLSTSAQLDHVNSLVDALTRERDETKLNASAQAELALIRSNALKELIDLYPQYLEGLTVEDVLKGKGKDAINTLKEELKYRNFVAVSIETINTLRKEELEINMKLNGQRKLLEGEDRETLANRVDGIHEEIAAQQKLLNINKAALLTFPTKDSNKQKSDSLSPGGVSLTGDKELAEARAALRLQELQEIKETQKAIADNEKYTLNERLVANSVYYGAVIQQSAEQKEKELKVEDAYISQSLEKQRQLVDKIRELRAGKGSYSDESRAEMIHLADLQFKDEAKLQEAAHIRQKAAQQRYNSESTKALEDHIKQMTAIRKGETIQWISEQEDAFAQAQLDALTGYMIDEARLKVALDDKLITRRKYQDELKKLQHNERIIELRAEEEHLQRLLSNQDLSVNERLQLTKRLNTARKSRADEEANIGSVGRNRPGRITDSVAKLFGGDALSKADMADQERYLQSFYDHSVELARTSADAIISINNAKFEAELDNINKLQEANTRRNDEERNAVALTAKNSIEYKNQIAKINAQEQAQNAGFEAEKRRVAQEQARFQKTASIASAIANGAVAVTKTLAELGPILGPPVMPLIIAATGVQVAAISNTPIPQYKGGTQNHKGGKFVAGDGNEIEYIAPPNKPGYWSKPTATLYDEPAGTKVLTLAQMARNTDTTMTYAPGEMRKVSENAANDMMYLQFASIIGDKLDETGERMAGVIYASRYRPQKQESMKDAIREMNQMQGY